MAEKMKTTLNKASVSKFLANVKDPQKRADSQAIVRMMQEITGEGPAMWGSSIVGFGSYHYKYASGREGD
jgi:nucleoid DNA-binding protein